MMNSFLVSWLRMMTLNLWNLDSLKTMMKTILSLSVNNFMDLNLKMVYNSVCELS